MRHAETRPRAQILIVDDDESMCDLLGSELASRGFGSAFETEAERALESLEARDVDVVVTDLQMRGMNGIELCDRIVAAHPDLPVILLTAHGTIDAAVAALRVRAHDFLTKPLDIDALVSALERAVRHRRLEEVVSAPDGSDATDGACAGEILVSRDVSRSGRPGNRPPRPRVHAQEGAGERHLRRSHPRLSPA